MARAAKRGLLLGLALATLAGIGGAEAQPATGAGPGMMGGGGPGMMGGNGSATMSGVWNIGIYLDALKSQLAITAPEEHAWKTYADTISGINKRMQALHQTMFEAMGTASWEERRDMMNQLFKAHRFAFDTAHQAATGLLLALDPAQQAKAQSILPGFASGPGQTSRP